MSEAPIARRVLDSIRRQVRSTVVNLAASATGWRLRTRCKRLWRRRSR